RDGVEPRRELAQRVHELLRPDIRGVLGHDIDDLTYREVLRSLAGLEQRPELLRARCLGIRLGEPAAWLRDLETPRQRIAKRLRLAADGDLGVAVHGERGEQRVDRLRAVLGPDPDRV